MQLICRKTDGRVKFAFSDEENITWLRGKLYYPIQANISEDEYEVLKCEVVPKYFCGDLYNFVNNEFIPADTQRVLEFIKAKKLEEVSTKYKSVFEATPRVETSLGYAVDGGRNNKDDFYSKWLTMGDTDTTTVKDADNEYHPNSTKADLEVIWKAIVAKGEALLQDKWSKEVQINTATTIEELECIGW